MTRHVWIPDAATDTGRLLQLCSGTLRSFRLSLERLYLQTICRRQ